MNTPIYGSKSSKQCALLGKLLIQKEPETAERLIKIYLPDQHQETDFSKIEDLFLRFCAITKITPEQYFEAKSITFKNDVRRVFIAVLLHYYNPKVYLQPTDNILLKYGFVTSIGRVLRQKKTSVSKMVREVIRWEKNYSDFSEQVNYTIEKLSRHETD